MGKQKNKTVVVESNDEEPRKSCMSQTQRILAMMSIEPALLLHMTASFLGNLTITDLTQYKACTLHFGYNQTYCEKMTAKNRPDEMKEYVAGINTWKQVIDNSFPIVYVLFLGAWSDIYGRKMPLLMSMFGYIIRYIGLLLVVYYTESTAETVGMVASIPISLTGGRTVLSMALYSYVADTTSIKDRTLRTGILTAVRTFGKSAGSALGGVLKKRGYDYTFIFAVGAGLDVVAFAYTLFLVRNTRKENVNRSKETSVILKDIFNLNNVKDSAVAFFKKRDNNGRLKLILLVAALVCTMAPMQGEESMLQLFVTDSEEIDWDTGDYGYYNTYRMLIAFIGGLVSLGLLVTIMKLDDYLLGVVACISQIAGSLIYAFATSGLMMYIAPAVDILNGSMIVATRSMISKIVPRSEIGKVNSFVGTIDSITPLPSNPIYSYIYQHTVNTFPGAVFLVSTGLTFPPLVIFSWFKCNRIVPPPEEKRIVVKQGSDPSAPSEGEDSTYGSTSEAEGRKASIVKAV